MVQHNKLSWVIPAALGKCENLTILDVSHNNFRGELPLQTFGTLRALTTINFSNNTRICGEVRSFCCLFLCIVWFLKA